jgi:hypothetical protein
MARRGTRIAIALVVAGFAASEIGLRQLTDRESRWNIRLGAALDFDSVANFRWKKNHRVAAAIVAHMERTAPAELGMR